MPLSRVMVPVKPESVPPKPWSDQGPKLALCTNMPASAVYEGLKLKLSDPVWASPPKAELAPTPSRAWMPIELTSNWSVGEASAAALAHSDTALVVQKDFTFRAPLSSAVPVAVTNLVWREVTTPSPGVQAPWNRVECRLWGVPNTTLNHFVPSSYEKSARIPPILATDKSDLNPAEAKKEGRQQGGLPPGI